jgi:hypothetical protein
MLNQKQRDIVDEVISGFSHINSGASQRIIVRYLRSALEHPHNIGFHPSLTPCGCEYGFRTVEEHGNTFTVQRCYVCSDPERFTRIPPSFLE